MSIGLAYFLNSIVMGGMEIHAVTLAGALNRDRYRPLVVIPTTSALDPLQEEFARIGVPVHRLDLIGDEPLSKRWTDFHALWRLLRQERVTILHQHRTAPFHGEWACLAAKVAGVPIVIASEHQAPPSHISLRQRWQSVFMDSLIDRIITVSEENRRVQLQHGGRRPHQISMIHNGIRMQDFGLRSPEQIAAHKQALGLTGASAVVGTVARLDDKKGIPYFLEMAALILSELPQTRFVIVGEGERHAEFVAYAAQLGIAEQVLFTGFRTDIPDVVSTFDIFVLPSLQEGLPLSILEAMALEKPVVATRLDGIPEAVEEGETGLLVPPRDSAALAREVMRLLQQKDLAQMMGQAAYRRVRTYFTAEVMANKVMTLYEEILSRKKLGCQARLEPRDELQVS